MLEEILAIFVNLQIRQYFSVANLTTYTVNITQPFAWLII
jgi:hypothetical protein